MTRTDVIRISRQDPGEKVPKGENSHAGRLGHYPGSKAGAKIQVSSSDCQILTPTVVVEDTTAFLSCLTSSLPSSNFMDREIRLRNLQYSHSRRRRGVPFLPSFVLYSWLPPSPSAAKGSPAHVKVPAKYTVLTWMQVEVKLSAKAVCPSVPCSKPIHLNIVLMETTFIHYSIQVHRYHTIFIDGLVKTARFGLFLPGC